VVEGEITEDKKFRVVATFVVVGIFLILVGLGTVPTRWGYLPPPIPAVSWVGVLLVVVGLVVALIWNPDSAGVA
jgi:hypothetical protein